MNTKLLWVLIAVIVVLIGAWFAFGRTEDMTTVEEMATTTSQNTQNVTPGATPAAAKTVTVAYTDQGFVPATVEMNVGDTVRFVNQATTEMWVGVDEHPTHTEFDGTATREHCANGANTNGSFDQCARSGPGTSWSYTFTKTGSFDYHNHAQASAGGTVVVR